MGLHFFFLYVYSGKSALIFNDDTGISERLPKSLRLSVEKQEHTSLIKIGFVYQEIALKTKNHKIWLGNAKADLFCFVLF